MRDYEIKIIYMKVKYRPAWGVSDYEILLMKTENLIVILHEASMYCGEINKETSVLNFCWAMQSHRVSAMHYFHDLYKCNYTCA